MAIMSSFSRKKFLNKSKNIFSEAPAFPGRGVNEHTVLATHWVSMISRAGEPLWWNALNMKNGTEKMSDI